MFSGKPNPFAQAKLRKTLVEESAEGHTYHINVGLHTSSKFGAGQRRLNQDEVVTAMKQHGMTPLDYIVAEPNGKNGLEEPTFAGTFSSPKTIEDIAGNHGQPNDLENLATSLHQEAIPIYDETADKGLMRGRHVMDWYDGNFDRSLFKTKKELLDNQ